MYVHRKDEVIYCFLPLENFVKRTRQEMVFSSFMHSINLNTSAGVLEITNCLLVASRRFKEREVAESRGQKLTKKMFESSKIKENNFLKNFVVFPKVLVNVTCRI